MDIVLHRESYPFFFLGMDTMSIKTRVVNFLVVLSIDVVLEMIRHKFDFIEHIDSTGNPVKTINPKIIVDQFIRSRNARGVVFLVTIDGQCSTRLVLVPCESFDVTRNYRTPNVQTISNGLYRVYCDTSRIPIYLENSSGLVPIFSSVFCFYHVHRNRSDV